MKTKITSYLITFLFLLLTSSLLSITSIFLDPLIQEKTLEIIISIFSLIIFLITSIIFGKKMKTNGLIHALILSSIYLIFAFLINHPKGIIKTTLLISKTITIMIGTLMGINLEN